MPPATGPSSTPETELKFSLGEGGLLSLRAHPILATPGSSSRLRSIYYDTPQHHLRNSGLSLRVRERDGAFVQTVTSSDEDRAFVQMLIDLSRRLGMQTVAEWVQDEAAAKLLVEMGCDYLQGALFRTASEHKPGSAAA